MRRILCLGDSNTYSWDPRSYLGSQYPPGVRWTGLLRGMGWEAANCGQNGLCIPPSEAFPAVADLLKRVGDVEVIAVMLGGNDLLNGASAMEAAASMEALTDFLAEKRGASRVLLIAPPPFRFGDWVQTQMLIDESVQLGRLYQALADRPGFLFADARAWDVELTFDGVHFSPAGHAAFAKGLGRVLEKI